MGNVAVAEELAGSDELDEIYRLEASENTPEDEPEDDEGADQGAGEGEEDAGGGGIKPEGMPHD